MIRFEMKRFDLEHCDLICDLIWKFCDSIWKIAKSRQIATTVTHYFQSKSHVSILFMPLINHPACPPISIVRWACRDYLTKVMVVGRWPTKTPHWAVSVYLLCSYSQLDKHVSRLAVSAINDDRRCRSGRDQRFDCMASPASKAFPVSSPCCPRCADVTYYAIVLWVQTLSTTAREGCRRTRRWS